VARARVLDINPRIQVECLKVFVDAETVGSVLAPPPDLLIDAIDSVGPKVELIVAAVRAGIPIISVMGAASRRDPAAIRCGDVSQSRNCPLARHIRKRLRERGIALGVTCIYSCEPAAEMSAAAENVAEEDEVLERGRKRRPIGSLSTLTGIFGLWAATEAIRVLVHT
jgi:tRNA threonylcarbamoyladenosine dehydratase